MRSHLIKEFLLPIKIIESSDNVFDADLLLKNENTQVYIGNQEFATIKGKGHIILDFGKELSGGIRILTSRFPDTLNAKMRIRFGESVGECCSELGEKNSTNHHAIRDFEIHMPILSDQSFGQTGFRFVRIDFLDNIEYRIVNFYAVYEHRDINFIGDFKCDDELINQIYDTCKHTLFLNLQENLFEGIKRDRLVWVGDLQPEVLAYSYLYNDYEIVKTAIDDSIKFNPLPRWFGTIPTYSFWLIDILYIYYHNTKDKDYVLDKFNYINGIIDQLDLCVDKNGDIDFYNCDAEARDFFFDWPTVGFKDAKEGNRYIFIYVLNHYIELCNSLNVKPNDKTNELIERLSLTTNLDLNKKQVIALGYLSNMIKKDLVKEKLFQGGPKGLSTFFSYFILKSMSEVGQMSDTLDILKEYYGGMLSRGATTFWEDFDIEWLNDSGRIDEFTPNGKKDLHGDYGGYCYLGYRHSLCHGWSVGPISFLIEKVAGISLKNDVLTINPNLGYLKTVDVVVPSLYGPITVNIVGKNIKVNKPKEIIYKG